MDTTTRPARYQRMSAEAQRMLDLGESGRHEFKRDAEAVSPNVLATLANWVALDSTRDVAHLLVGVDEVEDTETGLVRGVPCGLPKGLDKAVARLQDLASKTRPIPVGVFIIEEAVNEPTPFLRVEIRPTMPPHFDDEGRRQTREGRLTRALTDDELLKIYLDREASSFAARFRHTAVELREAVGAVGAQVDQIGEAIDSKIRRPLKQLAATADQAASAASNAEEAATMVGYDVTSVEHLVRDLRRVVEELQENSLKTLAARVVDARRNAWWTFTVDTWEHSSARAEALSRKLHDLLSREILLDEGRNAWEVRIWDDVRAERQTQRRARGTLKWWTETVKEVSELLENPSYQAPELPDLRAELRGDLDTALDDPDSLTNQFQATLTD